MLARLVSSIGMINLHQKIWPWISLQTCSLVGRNFCSNLQESLDRWYLVISINLEINVRYLFAYPGNLLDNLQFIALKGSWNAEIRAWSVGLCEKGFSEQGSQGDQRVACGSLDHLTCIKGSEGRERKKKEW